MSDKTKKCTAENKTIWNFSMMCLTFLCFERKYSLLRNCKWRVRKQLLLNRTVINIWTIADSKICAREL